MNPADAERVERARDFRELFHWGRPAKSLKRVKVPPAPDVLVKLGDLEAITYETQKGTDRRPVLYEHQFGEDSGRRPTLALDVDTGRLHIVGGAYHVEERGIVD